MAIGPVTENITPALLDIINRIREERAMIHKSRCEIQQACRRIGDYNMIPDEERKGGQIENVEQHLNELLTLVKIERVALEDTLIFLNKTV